MTKEVCVLLAAMECGNLHVLCVGLVSVVMTALCDFRAGCILKVSVMLQLPLFCSWQALTYSLGGEAETQLRLHAKVRHQNPVPRGRSKHMPHRHLQVQLTRIQAKLT